MGWENQRVDKQWSWRNFHLYVSAPPMFTAEMTCSCSLLPNYQASPHLIILVHFISHIIFTLSSISQRDNEPSPAVPLISWHCFLLTGSINLCKEGVWTEVVCHRSVLHRVHSNTAFSVLWLRHSCLSYSWNLSFEFLSLHMLLFSRHSVTLFYWIPL